MTAQQLRNSILQQAIQGRLVPQDPNDEPASVVIDKSLYKGKISILQEEEYPVEIPSNWCFCRLQDVAITIGGYAFKSDELKGNIGTRVIRISDVTPSGFSNKNIVRYNNNLLLEQYEVHEDDILIAMTGGTVGKSLYVDNLPERLLLNQRVAIVRAENIYPLYLDLVIKSPLTQDIVSERKNSTNDNISMVDIKGFIIPLPPLAEQRRIVAKIEELMPLVEKYGKAQTELDTLNQDLPRRLRQSVLQQAIQGKLVSQDKSDGTGISLYENICKHKEILCKSGQLKSKDVEPSDVLDEEIPFDIPESWKWCHMGDLISMRMGKTPPRGDSQFWSNANLPWVSISDMKDYGHVKSTKEYVSQYAADHAFKEISPVGSLLMSFKLTVGRTSILEIPAYHNEAIITINPYVDDDYAFRNYLFYLLPVLANLGDSKDAIKGKTLNSTSLYNLLIPLPPLAEQRRIVAKIEELFAEIDKLK